MPASVYSSSSCSSTTPCANLPFLLPEQDHLSTLILPEPFLRPDTPLSTWGDNTSTTNTIVNVKKEHTTAPPRLGSSMADYTEEDRMLYETPLWSMPGLFQDRENLSLTDATQAAADDRITTLEAWWQSHDDNARFMRLVATINQCEQLSRDNEEMRRKNDRDLHHVPQRPQQHQVESRLSATSTTPSHTPGWLAVMARIEGAPTTSNEQTIFNPAGHRAGRVPSMHTHTTSSPATAGPSTTTTASNSSPPSRKRRRQASGTPSTFVDVDM